jgi:hypothetical protein
MEARMSVDRTSISPHDILLALIAARDHVPATGTAKDRLHNQKQFALGLIDWAIIESDRVSPNDLDELSFKVIRKG